MHDGGCALRRDGEVLDVYAAKVHAQAREIEERDVVGGWKGIYALLVEGVRPLGMKQKQPRVFTRHFQSLCGIAPGTSRAWARPPCVRPAVRHRRRPVQSRARRGHARP